MNAVNQSGDLVFLHGWGLNAAVWASTRRHFEQQQRLYILDLPGYGRNKWLPDQYNLHHLANWVVESVPARAIWVGWSLGGMVALQAAINWPAHMAKLVLIATTPRFLNSRDWSCGIEPSLMEAFSLMLEQDYLVMLKNFFLIQAAGAKSGRKDARDFAEQVAQGGSPAPGVLSSGLKILTETDLRADLNKLDLPVHLIHGANDPLVPLDAAKYLNEQLGNGQLHTIMEAGHNPVMSHPEPFMNALKSCLYE